MIEYYSQHCICNMRLPEELSERSLMAISLLPTEGDDGCCPETEARPPHLLQSAVEQVPPLHMEVGFYISIHIVLSKQAQKGVQVECDLHITETGPLTVINTSKYLVNKLFVVFLVRCE